MDNSPNSATQIEKHILESAHTSHWLRSTFQLAIRRDPIDALKDAELLAAALRARALETFSAGGPFSPQITSALLKQHADSVSQLAKIFDTNPRPTATSHLRREISLLVMQIHQVARELHSSAGTSRQLDGQGALPSTVGLSL